tara:strand:- start:335 stop:919 length:585 start_codon:yes stop_codon:yes gene_type:complete
MLIEKLKNYNIILGSNSPRRKKILEEIGFKVTVLASNIDETYEKNLESKLVPIFLAKKKSKALKNKIKKKDILITADTVVLYNNKILSKPINKEDAKKTLLQLSSNTHEVITGVCITTINKNISFSSTTEVTFNRIEEKEINFYIKNHKPFDKAGSYAIQEWIGLIGIKKINGSYSNVVGLPSSRLYHELKKLF